MKPELVKKVAQALRASLQYDIEPDARANDLTGDEHEKLAIAAIRVALEEVSSPAFLRPLVEEQSVGEWDDKTIDADVAMFSAAIRKMMEPPHE